MSGMTIPINQQQRLRVHTPGADTLFMGIQRNTMSADMMSKNLLSEYSLSSNHMSVDCMSCQSPETLTARKTARVGVIGGDARQVTMVRSLSQAGYRLSVVGLGNATGLPEGVRICGGLSKLFEDAKTPAPECPKGGGGCRSFLILPLPASKDGDTVFCPLDPDIRISLSDVARMMNCNPGLTLLGGCLPRDFLRVLDSEGLSSRVVDYYDREELQIRNARITAEGAVMMAMELTDTALLGSRAAVLGYGRIGQFLSRILLSLGVHVTVCARRAESLTHAEGDGCDTLQLAEGSRSLHHICSGYDVIYNTVPVPLIGRSMLEDMDDHTLILDLASAPGGVDPEAARVLLEQNRLSGPRLVRAPSLPGKYAPETAGRIIADTVLNQLEERGRDT